MFVHIGLIKGAEDFSAELTSPAFHPAVSDEVWIVTAARRVLFHLFLIFKYTIAIWAR